VLFGIHLVALLCGVYSFPDLAPIVRMYRRMNLLPARHSCRREIHEHGFQSPKPNIGSSALDIPVPNPLIRPIPLPNEADHELNRCVRPNSRLARYSLINAAPRPDPQGQRLPHTAASVCKAGISFLWNSCHTIGMENSATPSIAQTDARESWLASDRVALASVPISCQAAREHTNQQTEPVRPTP